MAGEEEAAAADHSGSSTATTSSGGEKWGMEDLQRSVMESKDFALRSARSFQREQVPQAISLVQSYQESFFSTAKGALNKGIQHPQAAFGFALAASLLLMRGPRRFLFRHTLGRFQSEEAQFLSAEKKVKEFDASVNLMKMESQKLRQRAALAEKDMKHGQTQLMNAGNQIQSLAKLVYKLETQAADLMDGLREVPGRDALKLRAEVASMISVLRNQRIGLDKRIMKISDLGVSV